MTVPLAPLCPYRNLRGSMTLTLHTLPLPSPSPPLSRTPHLSPFPLILHTPPLPLSHTPHPPLPFLPLSHTPHPSPPLPSPLSHSLLLLPLLSSSLHVSHLTPAPSPLHLSPSHSLLLRPLLFLSLSHTPNLSPLLLSGSLLLPSSPPPSLRLSSYLVSPTPLLLASLLSSVAHTPCPLPSSFPSPSPLTPSYSFPISSPFPKYLLLSIPRSPISLLPIPSFLSHVLWLPYPCLPSLPHPRISLSVTVPIIFFTLPCTPIHSSPPSLSLPFYYTLPYLPLPLPPPVLPTILSPPISSCTHPTFGLTLPTHSPLTNTPYSSIPPPPPSSQTPWPSPLPTLIPTSHPLPTFFFPHTLTLPPHEPYLPHILLLSHHLPPPPILTLPMQPLARPHSYPSPRRTIYAVRPPPPYLLQGGNTQHLRVLGVRYPPPGPSMGCSPNTCVVVLPPPYVSRVGNHAVLPFALPFR
ncbi:hypothetical protein C7M84_018030 [Penaeus vannamei]|uniref:Uncharacterized protein n=1 Tax=Penaeus vannamei TaxID=6689 RepID=A0A3R7LVA0_PENVA|nr:hypothetical protein C7M84_018030 [Penaeus vannamei]